MQHCWGVTRNLDTELNFKIKIIVNICNTGKVRKKITIACGIVHDYNFNDI